MRIGRVFLTRSNVYKESKALGKGLRTVFDIFAQLHRILDVICVGEITVLCFVKEYNCSTWYFGPGTNGVVGGFSQKIRREINRTLTLEKPSYASVVIVSETNRVNAIGTNRYCKFTKSQGSLDRA